MPERWQVHRGRADTYLMVGKHAEAMADYERALELSPDDESILNNLSWLLSTSPVDEVRDSSRAIELATKACELTDYKAAYILSTLAAGYAEAGDFEKAIQWSQKAVDNSSDELREPLTKELESYRAGKPWREIQNVEEETEIDVSDEDESATDDSDNDDGESASDDTPADDTDSADSPAEAN
jgi:tetratricopeptide (TPR) repeat protein